MLARGTLQGLSPLPLQEFTRLREVMVNVERGLLHALAFDFNVELPLPLAWRFLDALLGEIKRPRIFSNAQAYASPRSSPRCRRSCCRCSRWTLFPGPQNSTGNQTLPICYQLFEDQASSPPFLPIIPLLLSSLVVMPCPPVLPVTCHAASRRHYVCS
jgi:hypothetical protein